MTSNQTPADRLTLSRVRLRQAMGEVTELTDQPGADSTGSSRPGWRATLMQNPGARLLFELGRGWWEKQPLRLVMPLISQTARVMLTPTAQRHPVGLILGAATVGAALVLVRPWRWLSVSALVTKLLPPLLSEIAKQSTATPSTPLDISHRSPKH